MNSPKSDTELLVRERNEGQKRLDSREERFPRNTKGVRDFLLYMNFFVEILGLPDFSADVLSLINRISMDNMSQDDLKKRIEALSDFDEC